MVSVFPRMVRLHRGRVPSSRRSCAMPPPCAGAGDCSRRHPPTSNGPIGCSMPSCSAASVHPPPPGRHVHVVPAAAAVDPTPVGRSLSTSSARSIGVKATPPSARPESGFTIAYEEFTRSRRRSPPPSATSSGVLVRDRWTSPTRPRPSSLRPHLYGRITRRTKDSAEFVDEATAQAVMERTGDVAAHWGIAGHDRPYDPECRTSAIPEFVLQCLRSSQFATPNPKPTPQPLGRDAATPGSVTPADGRPPPPAESKAVDTTPSFSPLTRAYETAAAFSDELRSKTI